MRKIIALLCVFTLLLSSCSNDEQSNTNEENLTQEGALIKKIVQSNGLVIDYFYNGNKLVQIKYSNGFRLDYEYLGNLITKHFFYVNDVLNEKYEYQYNADEKLMIKTRFTYPNNLAYKTEYIYNSDNTVVLKGYSGDFTSQTTLYNDRKIFLNSSGDVTKIERYKIVNNVNHIETSVFTFDDKNNYEKNIVGFNKINDWEFGGVQGALHNKLTETYSTTENSSVTNTQTTYVYNTNEFPKSLSTNFPSTLTAQLYYQ